MDILAENYTKRMLVEIWKIRFDIDIDIIKIESITGIIEDDKVEDTEDLDNVNILKTQERDPKECFEHSRYKKIMALMSYDTHGHCIKNNYKIGKKDTP